MLARISQTGADLATARAAVILVHGRGASAESILTLAGELSQPVNAAKDGLSNVAFLAPQAPGNAWYPYSFLAPIEQNEPYLSNSLRTLENLVDQLGISGIPAERVGLVGFSQGACLALEFAARHARRYGAIAGLSGGLIGPPGTPRDYPGSLEGTPVFLGCSDVDPHIPEARVWETDEVMEKLGAQVTTRIYPDMGHTVSEEELSSVRRMLMALVQAA
jgi:phospholipase/carboxylesterase